MNEWSNDQAQAEGWRMHPTLGIVGYGWTFMRQAIDASGKYMEGETQKHAIVHVEARARAGSAYHIEALARHYFQE